GPSRTEQGEASLCRPHSLEVERILYRPFRRLGGTDGWRGQGSRLRPLPDLTCHANSSNRDLTRKSCSSSQVAVFKPLEGILIVVERDRFARLVVSEPYAECIEIITDPIHAPLAIDNGQLSGPYRVDPFRISSLGLAISEDPHSFHLIEGPSQGAFA